MVDDEVKFLETIKKAIERNDTPEKIKQLLESRRKKRRSSIYSSIEFDIKGYFGFEQTEISQVVPKLKFRDLTKEEMKELLINRIKSVKETEFELPEIIFKVHVFRVKYEEELIDVEEVARRHWEFILYKSKYYRSEYYADIVFDGSATYNKLIKLKMKDSLKIPDMNDDEIQILMNKYREENWS